MKRYSIIMTALWLLHATLILFACEGKTPDYQDQQLFQRAVELERHQCQLNASIDSLWDATTAQLENALPPDFPAIDRNIFLKARNADHIRMFMSFKLLDNKAQSLVANAGKCDALLAKKAHRLLKEKQAFEQEKNHFLQKLANKNPWASRKLAEKIQLASAQACNS